MTRPVIEPSELTKSFRVRRPARGTRATRVRARLAPVTESVRARSRQLHDRARRARGVHRSQWRRQLGAPRPSAGALAARLLLWSLVVAAAASWLFRRAPRGLQVDGA